MPWFDKSNRVSRIAIIACGLLNPMVICCVILSFLYFVYMPDLINTIFPNQTSPIPYYGLLIERILFDFRRGLPVFLNYQSGYFIKPTEFTDPSIADDIKTIITGDENGNVIISNDAIISHQSAAALLSLIKMSELSPSITLYPSDTYSSDNEALKQCITHITLDDLEKISVPHYTIEKMTQTILPTSYDATAQLIAYRVIPSFYEYYALIIKNPDLSKPVNVRLHAECLTGDLLGSLRCDCQPQLHKALKEFGNADGGVIIYIRQEGRNIGLLNKLKAYNLQNQGHDTVDANLLLGFKLDERDYQASALILQNLGIHHIRLFTNNPEKITAMEKYNIHIADRVAHYTPSHQYNAHYIETKQKRIGHLPKD
jgi:GTP cyclohydrolase II